jgi:hypothetical protein
MTSTTVSAKIPQDQRDRLDELAVQQDVAMSRIVAVAIEQYLGGTPTIEAPKPPTAHPLTAELAAKYATVDRLQSEVTELQQSIEAMTFKLSQAGQQVEITPTGGGLLGQIGDRLGLRQKESDQRAAISELEKTRNGAIDLLQSKRSELARTYHDIGDMEMQIGADGQTAVFQELYDRYVILAAELNAIAIQYNDAPTNLIRENIARLGL